MIGKIATGEIEDERGDLESAVARLGSKDGDAMPMDAWAQPRVRCSGAGVQSFSLCRYLKPDKIDADVGDHRQIAEAAGTTSL